MHKSIENILNKKKPEPELLIQDCTTCQHSTDNFGRCMGCDDCDADTFDGWEALT